MQIAENLHLIQQQISTAAQEAGRDHNSVQLIAVSKTKPMNLIQEAYEAGQLDFGENRVQELREKYPQLPEARWHMIGSLQRNKVKYIAPFIHLIHSVDSRRLLVEINKQAEKCDRSISCLLQLNISNETAKSGMDEAEVKEILMEPDQFPFVRIEGLMGMAAFVSDKKTIRNQFERLRMAAVAFAEIKHDRIDMRELSMGMSGDFQIAIGEGATMVRIGSAVFGSRKYP